ncbi:hypothetical protein QF028_002553 [Neobacillus sp. B4I6]
MYRFLKENKRISMSLVTVFWKIDKLLVVFIKVIFHNLRNKKLKLPIFFEREFRLSTNSKIFGFVDIPEVLTSP